MVKKVLIVGGVAGGASAAARLRRLDENAEIVMFERDEHISFANCGLPYYIGETIKDRDKLLVQTPKAMHDRFNIDVRTFSEVTDINPAEKSVTVKSRSHGTYKESYDYLVLSPGAKAIKPPIPGIESSRILTLRNIPDTDLIKSFVDKKEINSAIVIGGGFIGVEMAENLIARGISVTLVEAAPHILAPFDTDMVGMLEKEMTQNGINLVLNDGVKFFSESGQKIDVTLSSSLKLSADFVVLAIGVAPDTAFIRDCGIDLGPRGHIVVNEKMETNLPDIYAVGDAVEIVDFVTGTKSAVPLAGPANKQGRIAADNIAGLASIYRGTQGTSILKVFSLSAASTGANERALQKAGINHRAIHIHPLSHASYYPGALPMSLKLIFSDNGRVLGAQAVGYDGVDKRIDVIATVIRLHGTINDLAELELSYAPPFSSAKDPVNMAGFVAQNVLAGKSHMISWSEMESSEDKDFILLDVRSSEEYKNGHIENSVNIPVDSLRDRMGELDRDKKIVEYCQVGLRGYVADRILTQNGFRVENLSGGYKSALMQGMATEEQPPSTGTPSAGAPVQSIDPDTQRVVQHGPAATSIQGKGPVHFDKALDACGLCCPGPLLQVKASLDELKDGQILRVTASDPGFYEDIKAWCRRTGNIVADLKRDGGNVIAFIQKGSQCELAPPTASTAGAFPAPKENKTIVVFSGDLDKAIASFIIANGAASMGRKVTMFFTFWGLNILRKPEKIEVEKGLMDKMFGMMMPRGSKKLQLSNMNMMGLGAKMIRQVMKNKNVSSLEELIKSAIDSNVDIVACQMSMDVMGIKREELIDGVKIGGVGYYLGEAEDSNVNLFI